MKKYLRITSAALCMILALTGCQSKGGQGGEGGQRGGMPSMGQEQEQTKTAVETTTLKSSSISSVYMYSGTIQPSTQVDVSSTVSGKVATVNYDVGDRVNKGDVLFTMDTESIENSINISRASVNSAQVSVKTAETNLELANGASVQSSIASAENSIQQAENSLANAQTDLKSKQTALDTAQKSIDTAQTSLDNAKIQLDKAESDYNINKQLFEAGGISQDTLTTSENTYKQAQNSYLQAQNSLTTAQNSYSQAQDNLTTAQTSLKQAEQTLEQAQKNYDIVANQTTEENIIKAQNSLESAQAQKESSEAQLKSSMKELSDAVVTAPISGTVLECNVTAGANLSNGTTPFVIINLDTVDLEVNVSEQIINSINVGDEVEIKISTLSSDKFKGTISELAPGSNTDGTYKVKISIDNSDGQLKSGMFAEVYFTKEKNDNAVVIPRSAVMSSTDEEYVYIVEGDTAKKVVVTTGIDNGDEIEVVTGLSFEQKVVTKGQTYLKDGDIVNDVTNSQSKQADEASSEQESDEGQGGDK